MTPIYNYRIALVIITTILISGCAHTAVSTQENKVLNCLSKIEEEYKACDYLFLDPEDDNNSGAGSEELQL